MLAEWLGFITDPSTYRNSPDGLCFVWSNIGLFKILFGVVVAFRTIHDVFEFG